MDSNIEFFDEISAILEKGRLDESNPISFKADLFAQYMTVKIVDQDPRSFFYINDKEIFRVLDIKSKQELIELAKELNELGLITYLFSESVPRTYYKFII